jgi:hypothetical protein
VAILNIIDDHSRLCLGSDTRRKTTGPDVVASFRKGLCPLGNSAGVLTDNGAVLTAKQRGEAGSPWKLSWVFSASNSTTPGPTTHKPAARWSGSTKPRRNGWPRNLPRQPCAGCNANWTGSHLLQHCPSAPSLQRRTPTEAYGARPKAILREQNPRALPGPQRHRGVPPSFRTADRLRSIPERRGIRGC